MKILVISGFLGAGKTTFIKELIKLTGKNIVVMENEFGNAALDSNAVSGSGIEVLEFMEGCVCCTMKDSFVNSVLTVSATLDPEYLVIEPTGAAELGSVINSLRKLCYGSISTRYEMPWWWFSQKQKTQNLSKSNGSVRRYTKLTRPQK